MRGQHTDLPEVLLEVRLVAIEMGPELLQVAVEGEEVARLIATVVLDDLAVARRPPGPRFLRCPRLIDDINSRDRIPALEFTQACPQIRRYVALVHVQHEVDVMWGACERNCDEDHGRRGSGAGHYAVVREQS